MQATIFRPNPRAICPLRKAAAALVSFQEGRPSGAPLGSPVMSVDTAKVKVAKNLAPRRLTLPPIWEPRSPRDENTRGSVPAPRREAMEVLDLLGEQLEATSRFNFALRVAAMQAGSVEKVRLRNPTTGNSPPKSEGRLPWHLLEWGCGHRSDTNGPSLRAGIPGPPRSPSMPVGVRDP